ncbi:hypothetical protein V3C99_015838, partial [Haemonchus contortus]
FFKTLDEPTVFKIGTNFSYNPIHPFLRHCINLLWATEKSISWTL